jgi:hypothetical protein
MSSPGYTQTEKDERWEKNLLEAMASHDEGNHEKAINSLSLGLKISGQLGIMDEIYQAEMHYLLAKIYFETGALDKAEESLKKLFDISPDFTKEEDNVDFRQKADAVKERFKNEDMILQIELIDAYRTNDFLDIVKSAMVQISTAPGEQGGLVGNIESMHINRPGYMFLRISIHLVNYSDEDLFFNFNRLKLLSSGEEQMLLFLARFDDDKEGFTVYNVNAPKISAKSKRAIELVSIIQEKCPSVTLQYKNVNPVPIDLSSIETKEEVKQPALQKEEQIVIKKLIMGKKLSAELEGEEIVVYLQEIVPGSPNTLLTSAYYDKLPVSAQEKARQMGYEAGDVVRITMSEDKGRVKIIPPEKDE